MSPRIRATLRRVATFVNKAPGLAPLSRMSVTPQTEASASHTCGAPGKTPAKYSPKAMAASATGAANPTVAEIHPARNPSAG